MVSVERIISLGHVKNPGYELRNKSKNNKKENPEVPFKEVLKREIEKERLSKNPYVNKKITGLPIYTASFIKSRGDELVVAVIEEHRFDRYS